MINSKEWQKGKRGSIRGDGEGSERDGDRGERRWGGEAGKVERRRGISKEWKESKRTE